MRPGPRDDLRDVAGLRVGQAVVPGGGSGCTVVLGPMRAQVEIMGMAGGSREFVTLDPAHVARQADALLLTGGSAFGLAAADGVMGWLEESGQGFATSAGVVPVVPAAVLFDLAPGRPRPGPAEGRRACDDATAAGTGPLSRHGGAGAGARVGKLLGPEFSMAGGLGSASIEVSGYTVAALAVVNALGAVVDEAGKVVAGARPDPEAPPVSGVEALLAPVDGSLSDPSGREFPAGENTTLCVVATDAPLLDADLRRFLRMASMALARRVYPVATPFDGDMVFGLVPVGMLDPTSRSPKARVPEPRAAVEVLALGAAAGQALERALLRAVAAGAGPPGPGEPGPGGPEGTTREGAG